MTYSQEILDAVAVLDNDRPGWHREIDRSRFRLRMPCHCIVGQVYETTGIESFRREMRRLFGRGCGPLFASTRVPRFMRWFMPPGYRAFWPLSDFEDQWLALIAERLEADRDLATSLAVEEPEEIFA